MVGCGLNSQTSNKRKRKKIVHICHFTVSTGKNQKNFAYLSCKYYYGPLFYIGNRTAADKRDAYRKGDRMERGNTEGENNEKFLINYRKYFLWKQIKYKTLPTDCFKFFFFLFFCIYFFKYIFIYFFLL